MKQIGLWSFAATIFVCSLVVFPAVGGAVVEGLYAGTFDPPTPREMAIARCALGDASVHKECQAIGKSISRLVVVVKQDGDADPLTSTRERVLMVKKALQKYGERVEIVAAPGGGEEKARSLLEDGKVEQLVRFADERSYHAARLFPFAQDSRVRWVVFSLNQQRSSSPAVDPKGLPANVKLLSGIQPLKGSFDPGMTKVIERLGLYREVEANLAGLQKSLFEASWKDFLKDLKSACPATLSEKECAQLASDWDGVSIADDDATSRTEKNAPAKFLIYKKAQSEDRWAEKFANTALQFLQGSASYAQFKPVAENMSSKVYQGYPEGKLFHLRTVFFQKQRPSVPLKVSEKPVACSAPTGKNNMDIVRYTADRFPQAFAVFLKEQFRKRSILPSDLYVHNQTVEGLSVSSPGRVCHFLFFTNAPRSAPSQHLSCHKGKTARLSGGLHQRAR